MKPVGQTDQVDAGKREVLKGFKEFKDNYNTAVNLEEDR